MKRVEFWIALYHHEIGGAATALPFEFEPTEDMVIVYIESEIGVVFKEREWIEIQGPCSLYLNSCRVFEEDE